MYIAIKIVKISFRTVPPWSPLFVYIILCRSMNGTNGMKWNMLVNRFNAEFTLPLMNLPFLQKQRLRTFYCISTCGTILKQS